MRAAADRRGRRHARRVSRERARAATAACRARTARDSTSRSSTRCAAPWTPTTARPIRFRRGPDDAGGPRHAAGSGARCALGITHVERNGHHYVAGFAGRAPCAEQQRPSLPRIPISTRTGPAARDSRFAAAASRSPRSTFPASRPRSHFPIPHALSPMRVRRITSRRRQPMTAIRVGIIMNGVTGRMGTNQHLVRSINAIRAQGGVALADGARDHARPDPRRPQRGEGRGAGAGARRRALDDRPRRARSRIATTPSTSTRRRRDCAPSSSARRSPPASTSTPRSRSRRRSTKRSTCTRARAGRRRQARRRAGQAVAARACSS